MLQVAVGVVKNAKGEILISLRDESLHQGGLWEFPGGKIESGETAEQALTRELNEELAITVIAATPLITIRHQYPDLAVQLNVFLVEHFSGDAKTVKVSASNGSTRPNWQTMHFQLPISQLLLPLDYHPIMRYWTMRIHHFYWLICKKYWPAALN